MKSRKIWLSYCFKMDGWRGFHHWWLGCRGMFIFDERCSSPVTNLGDTLGVLWGAPLVGIMDGVGYTRSFHAIHIAYENAAS